MVGYWSTLAMNIPDFMRFARSRKDQVIGQLLGLPLPTGELALCSVAVTSATVVIDGKAIRDPVDLAGGMEGLAVAIGLWIIMLDTLCVHFAANVVAPADDFTAIFPKYVDFARSVDTWSSHDPSRTRGARLRAASPASGNDVSIHAPHE